MARLTKTIAIVDDDASVRRALSRLVRSVGLEAEPFATAEEFLDAPRAAAVDCLIVDLQLPGLTGLQLQQRLKTEGRNVPVVFVTAYGNNQVRAQALGAGAVALLDKPFTEQALLEALGQALGSLPAWPGPGGAVE
jgi:FixJ family two-component response regulator